MVQSTYLKRVAVGLSPPTEPDPTGLLALDRLHKAYDCYEFKREFDQRYLASDWNSLEHRVLVFAESVAFYCRELPLLTRRN